MERQRQQYPVAESNYSTAWLIVLSVILHLIFLAWIIRPMASVQANKARSVNIIKAHLYLPASPPPPEIAAKITSEIKSSEPIQQSVKNPQPVITSKLEPKKLQPENIPSKTDLVTAPSVIDNNPSNKKEALDKPAVQHHSTQIEKAYRHIGQRNQSKIEQMAAEAAAEFESRKNSPVIASGVNNHLSEDEKLLQSTVLKANCDGVARKTTAILLTFMGGNIQCTSKPDVQPYIQRQLDKVGAGENKH